LCTEKRNKGSGPKIYSFKAITQRATNSPKLVTLVSVKAPFKVLPLIAEIHRANFSLNGEILYEMNKAGIRQKNYKNYKNHFIFLFCT
jgi:hypothetical protein